MTDWSAGVVLAAAVQAVVLAVALGLARERAANRWLALALLVLAGMLIVYPLGWRGRGEVPVWLAFLPVNLPLALGPLLYATARSTAQRPWGRGAWLHGVAPALQLLYLATLSLLPGDSAAGWKDDVHDPAIKPLIEFAVLISLAGYAAGGLRLLRGFRGRLAAARSDADLHDARWLFRLLATLIVAFGVVGAVRIYTHFVGELDSGVYLVWLAIWSAWLGVEGWRVAGVPAPDLGETAGDGAADHGDAAPARADWAALGTDWEARLRDAGWWREPDLTLAGLARRLGTNTLYLSRAINEGLGMNFNEMVNRLRAEEVALQIERGGAANLLPLALEAGFSSKATFNRAFRARYRVSPSDYRRRLTS